MEKCKYPTRNLLIIMSILKFSDGEQFDTSGPIRKEHRPDGWYVIGDGKLIPVKDANEADELIKLLTR